MKNTERLLLEIGLRPSRRGFAQSAMLLCILRDRPEIRSSSAAYALAAERLIATPGQLEHNLRMTIHEAWERGDRALLRRLLPWCGDACPPETKDFLFGLAAWLRIGIPENVLPHSGGDGEREADGGARTAAVPPEAATQAETGAQAESIAPAAEVVQAEPAAPEEAPVPTGAGA